MTSIKYDFSSCYDAYDFFQFDDEQVNAECEPNELSKTVEDILSVLLTQSEIEAPQPIQIRFPDPIKLLTTCRNKTRKTLLIAPKSITFNKTKMAKLPDIELNTAQIFKSVFDMIGTLNSEKSCREHLDQLLWNGEPICSHCGSQRENHYNIKTRGKDKGRYKCKDCRLPFSATIGTIFDKSRIPLQKWFIEVYFSLQIRKVLVVIN